MGLLKSNFQLQLAAKLVRDTFYPFTNGFSKRGALGYIRNRKTEGKNHPKPQNRKKIRPKPKTAYKTVKNRYNGDKWGIQSKLN